MGNLIHVLAKERNLSDGAIGLAKRKGKIIKHREEFESFGYRDN